MERLFSRKIVIFILVISILFLLWTFKNSGEEEFVIRKIISDMIEDLNDKLGYEFKYSETKGGFRDGIVLYNVSIFDNKKLIFQSKKLKIDYNPFLFFFREKHIKEIKLYNPRFFYTRKEKKLKLSEKFSNLSEFEIDKDKFINIPIIRIISGKIFIKDKIIDPLSLNTEIENFNGKLIMDKKIKRMSLKASGNFRNTKSVININAAITLKKKYYLWLKFNVKNLSAKTHGNYIFHIAGFKYKKGTFDWNSKFECLPGKTVSTGELWLNNINTTFLPKGLKKPFLLKDVDGKVEYINDKKHFKSLNFKMNDQKITIKKGQIIAKNYKIEFESKNFNINSLVEQFPNILKYNIKSKGKLSFKLIGNNKEQKYIGTYKSNIVKIMKNKKLKNIEFKFILKNGKYFLNTLFSYNKGKIKADIEYKPDVSKFIYNIEINDLKYKNYNIKKALFSIDRTKNNILINNSFFMMDNKKINVSGTIKDNKNIDISFNFDEGNIDILGKVDIINKEIYTDLKVDLLLTGKYIFSKFFDVSKLKVNKIKGNFNIKGKLDNIKIIGETEFKKCSFDNIVVKTMIIGFQYINNKFKLTRFLLNTKGTKLISINRQDSNVELSILGKTKNIYLISSILNIFLKNTKASEFFQKFSGASEFTLSIFSYRPLFWAIKLRSEKFKYNSIPIGETEIIFSYENNKVNIKKCYIAKLGKIKGNFEFPDNIDLLLETKTQNIKELLNIFGFNIYRLKGELISKINISGSFSNILAKGKIEIKNGKINEFEFDRLFLNINSNNNNLNIAELSILKDNKNIFSLDGKIGLTDNNQLSLKYKINNISFENIINSFSIEYNKLFFYNKLKGKFGATGTINGTIKDVESKINIFSKDITIFGIQIKDLIASIFINRSKVSILNLELSKGDQKLIIRGNIPIDNIDKNEMSVFFTLPEEKRSVIIGKTKTYLGNGGINFYIHGLMKKPKIDGNIIIKNGNLKLEFFSESINSLNSNIIIKNNIVNIKKLDGKLFDNDIKVNGNIDLSDVWNPLYSINLNANEFKFKIPDQLNLKTNNLPKVYGKAAIFFNILKNKIIKLPKIIGKIDLYDTKIFIKERADVSLPQMTFGGFQGKIDLNVNNNVWIKGSLLESELSGKLSIESIKEKKVDLHGKLVLNRGTFNYLNNKFDIDNGTILCQIIGDSKPEVIIKNKKIIKEPKKVQKKYQFKGKKHSVILKNTDITEVNDYKIFVNLHAEKTIDNVDVYMDVSGDINKMSMNIWSDPEMEEDKLLSVLNRRSYINLFDSKSSNTSNSDKLLSFFQNDIQTRFLSGFGNNVMKKLNFDTFNINTTADITENGIDNKLGIDIGKYFDKNLYVKYIKDFFGKDNNEILGLEIKTNNKVIWDGELNQRDGYKVGLKFKYSF